MENESQSPAGRLSVVPGSERSSAVSSSSPPEMDSEPQVEDHRDAGAFPTLPSNAPSVYQGIALESGSSLPSRGNHQLKNNLLSTRLTATQISPRQRSTPIREGTRRVRPGILLVPLDRLHLLWLIALVTIQVNSIGGKTRICPPETLRRTLSIPSCPLQYRMMHNTSRLTSKEGFRAGNNTGNQPDQCPMVRLKAGCHRTMRRIPLSIQRTFRTTRQHYDLLRPHLNCKTHPRWHKRRDRTQLPWHLRSSTRTRRIRTNSRPHRSI